MTDKDASAWQKQIEGEWWGVPSIFDADGNHQGFDRVNRSSVHEDGSTRYYMTTFFEATGPLRYRFDVREFDFALTDTGKDRIYLGPDFIGAGHPYGGLVDAHYYSPAWESDLRTMVHILPDGETQVYSSLLYEGATIVSVFNGVYINVPNHANDAAARDKVEAWNDQERVDGPKPHLLPPKATGRWTGSMQVFGADQEKVGDIDVSITHEPVDLLRANQTVTISGAFERSYTFERFRNRNLHTYNGPDMYGNGRAYGRALYTSQHAFGEAWKIKGREFIIDDDYTMSVVWQTFQGDRPEFTCYGVMSWEADV
ncbi:MAG: hypothetical protein ACR2N2_11730 [Acidimicrobiia bacterium]